LLFSPLLEGAGKVLVTDFTGELLWPTQAILPLKKVSTAN